MSNIKSYIIIIAFISLLISIILNIGIGAFSISFETILKSLFETSKYQLEYQVIMDIRVPRVLLGILVGIAFGVCGVMMQTLFKNPLADPSIIGVSAGASAGVVLFMMFSSYLPQIFYKGILSYFSIPLSAFLGAVITILIIYRLSTIYNKVAVTVMLLAGIAVNALLGALVGVFSYISTEEELKSFTFWTMGSLANSDNSVISVLIPIMIVTLFIAWYKRIELNILLLGEDEAKNSGVNTEKLKKIIIVCVSLAIGASVAYCGIIGFVGLVVPHISRLLVGANHRYLLPLSAILGPMILLWADAISRIVIQPAELPIGIITSILGAPFFLWLLIKSKQGILN